MTRQLLRQLIERPSVNPMGREVSGPEYFETQVTDFLEELFQQWNTPYLKQLAGDGLPKRHNLVGWINGEPSPEAGGRVMVWEAHQDTVPVEGMTIPPWTPEERGGRIYGRGACDVKGPMAAMLSAFRRLSHQDHPPPVTIAMACSVNEEFGCTGARDLASLWRTETKGPFAREPDAVVVAEPTQLDLVTAHKGVTRWRCRTRGVAAHSSTPELGDNAIYKMAKVVAALERYADEVAALPGHQVLGSPTLSVGLIEGGISVNVVPDECWIEIDRRLLPGEDPRAAFQHAVDFTRDQGAEADHNEPYIATPALSDDRNGGLAERIENAVRCVSPEAPPPRRVGAAYCSDASHFSHWPTVVFGPGSIDQAHTCDEWIEIAQLEAAAEIFYQLAVQPWPPA